LPVKSSALKRAKPKAGTAAKTAATSTARTAAAHKGPIELRRAPGRIRSDSSRVAILNATLKLLETIPLQQISIESIAREAGVGKATIYRWWSSKAAVVIEAFIPSHAARTPMPKGVSPREALVTHMHMVIEQYSGWSGRIIAQLLAEGQSDPDVLREIRERFSYGRRALVREVLAEARKNGEIRADVDIELQMDILYAPIYFRLIMGHLPLDRKFADEHCKSMLQILGTGSQVAAAAPKRRRVA
jgi:AcrR family transcriptional regulator